MNRREEILNRRDDVLELYRSDTVRELKSHVRSELGPFVGRDGRMRTIQPDVREAILRHGGHGITRALEYVAFTYEPLREIWSNVRFMFVGPSAEALCAIFISHRGLESAVIDYGGIAPVLCGCEFDRSQHHIVLAFDQIYAKSEVANAMLALVDTFRPGILNRVRLAISVVDMRLDDDNDQTQIGVPIRAVLDEKQLRAGIQDA